MVHDSRELNWHGSSPITPGHVAAKSPWLEQVVAFLRALGWCLEGERPAKESSVRGVLEDITLTIPFAALSATPQCPKESVRVHNNSSQFLLSAYSVTGTCATTFHI